MKYAVQSTNKHNAFQYVVDNPAGEFTDEDDKKGIKKRIKIIIKLTKRHMKRNLNSIQVAITAAVWESICIHLQTGEYSLSYELYFPSSSIDSSKFEISAATH